MNKPTTPLSRTCLACGLEKPLAAFLQISGTQGTVYGNICSNCRSTGAKGKAILPKPSDEEQSGGVGLKIDSKTRIQQEFQKKLQEKKLKDLTHEEKVQREKLILTKTERGEIKDKAEKYHRQGFIEVQKKPGFIGEQAKKQPSDKKPTQETGFMTEKEREIAEQKLKEALEHETQLNPDLGQTFIDFQLEKFKTARFGEIMDLIGSPNFKTMVRLYKDRAGILKKENGGKPEATDPFVDYVEKTSKPKGRM